MTQKDEITQLKRENTRLAKAVVRQKKGIDDRQAIIDAAPAWEKRWGDVRNELSDVKRAKNNLQEEKTKLERSNSSLIQEKDQLEAVLSNIQRDIKVVSEAIYGEDFDPSNIDRLMPMMSQGIEYIPRQQVEGGPYVEPNQRLLRIIWRHTYWGLNPFMTHAQSPYGANR
jgi:hypothetical protein